MSAAKTLDIRAEKIDNYYVGGDIPHINRQLLIVDYPKGHGRPMLRQTPTNSGRLNAFQRVMLHWSSIHPYNATHTFKIAGPPRHAALTRAVRETYLALGVGRVQLSDDCRNYSHAPDAEAEVAIEEPETFGSESLEQHISREMNRPFARTNCRPFRISIVPCGSEFHHISTTYDHWMADSVAARILLRGILGRYLGFETLQNERPPTLYPPTYRKAFRSYFGPIGLPAAILRSMQQWRNNRSAWRVAFWSNKRWDVNYQRFCTSSGTVARLKEFARSNSATVHDVILAAFSRALARSMPSRGRERGIALGSIVDSRSVADIDLSNSLGAFLGYYLVRNQPDASATLASTVREIAARTAPIKARHRYLDSAINMQATNLVWPWLDEADKPHYTRSVLPMTGGVSNVVVREPWIDANRDKILEYHRVAPTGPLLPLVITPTTLGDSMNIGATYRIAGFARAKIDGLMANLIEQLENPHGSSVAGRQGRFRVLSGATPHRVA